MIQRLALLVFVVGAPVVLSSCALARAPFNMASRMMSVGKRAVGFGADNNAAKPLHLDAGEIERAWTGEVPAPPPMEKAEHVAVR